ncbi:MAG TPA: hypothetical protein VHV83_15475 [Armatimonadota bacterium]|nr:hypothetical protein [Armatimonadota bacterium]
MIPNPRDAAIMWFEKLLDEYLDLPPEDDYSQMAMQVGEKQAKIAVKAAERKAFAAKFHDIAMKMYRGESVNEDKPSRQ